MQSGVRLIKVQCQNKGGTAQILDGNQRYRVMHTPNIINRKREKHRGAHSHNEILLGVNKEQTIDTCDNTDDSQKHHVE